MPDFSDFPSGPFRNNVPDPLLAGSELPAFKFELEKSKGRADGGSFGKEATVEQLPISKGIAGYRCGSSPASSAISSRAPCASFIGTPTPTSGSISLPVSSASRLEGALPERDRQCRRRCLYPARLRPFDREYRQRTREDSAGIQYRRVPIHRSERLDGGQSGRVDRRPSRLAGRGNSGAAPRPAVHRSDIGSSRLPASDAG